MGGGPMGLTSILFSVLLQRRQGPVHLSEVVDLHHTPELLRRCVFKTRIQRHCGHMNPGINATEAPYRSFSNTFDLIEIRNVTGDVSTLPASSGDFVYERSQTGLAARRDYHLGSALCKAERCLASD